MQSPLIRVVGAFGGLFLSGRDFVCIKFAICGEQRRICSAGRSGRSIHGYAFGYSLADGLKQFFHIPDAKAPLGELRWRLPQPAEPWAGVRDASKAGPACMQVPAQEGGFFGESHDQGMDEDCLHLNIRTRAETPNEKLPSMVWIHGGALVTGEGAAYSGVELTKQGIVLITINYRLGLFGYLAHEELSAEHPQGVSGNRGVRDQIQALARGRDNISAFGGDPDSVTIFG